VSVPFTSFGNFELILNYLFLNEIFSVGAPSTISVPPLILRIVHRFKGEDSNIGIDGARCASRHLFGYVTCVWFL
jgi:hypothetical protein